MRCPIGQFWALSEAFFKDTHHAHYLSAIKMFFHEPLFGVGPKMFRHLCDENIFYVYQACSTHPHNTYIQLLAETGIFSFTFILLIFFLRNTKICGDRPI